MGESEDRLFGLLRQNNARARNSQNPALFELAQGPSDSKEIGSSIFLKAGQIEGAARAEVASDQELVALWLLNRSVNTRKTYETEARRFFSYLEGTRLKEVRVAELLKFQAALSETRAPSSVALTLSVVRAIFSFGFRLGYLERDLGSFLKPPRVDRSLNERILSESEVQKLFASARPGRDRLLLKTIYVAGLRISEALTLTCADLIVRDDGGQITVHGKGGKVREVLLPAGLFLELQEFVSERSGSTEFLFSSRSRAKSPLSRFQAFRILKDAAMRAGLDEKVSPHWLRHAHATHALERGCPVHLVQETLGHSSLSVTGRYLHARPEDSSARYLG